MRTVGNQQVGNSVADCIVNPRLALLIGNRRRQRDKMCLKDTRVKLYQRIKC